MPLRFSQLQSDRPRKTLAGRLFGFGKFAIVASIIGVLGWLAVKQTVQDQLRGQVQAKITQALSGTGIRATVGQARFHDGQGLELNDLVVELAEADANAAHSKIEIYEAFIHAPATLADLATGQLKPTKFEIRRAKLQVVRSRDGSWDLQEAVQQLMDLRPPDQDPVPVSLVDCEINFIDQTKTSPQPVQLSNLNLTVAPIVFENQPMIQVNGNLQSRAISSIHFAAWINKPAATWRAEFGATDAQLSAELFELLPESAQSEFSQLKSLSGKININAQATGAFSLDQIPSFSVAGDISKLTIDDTRLPVAVQDTSAQFQINNQGFAVSNVVGKLGEGNFEGNYWQLGFLQRQQWHCDGYVNRFNYGHDTRMRMWLPRYCKTFCMEYKPAGICDTQFDMTFDGTELKREIHAQLKDMSFRFFKFPYQVDHCVGNVDWKDNDCTFNVRSEANNQLIAFTGFAKGIGKSPTFEINISVPGDLPMDQKMFDALKAQPVLAKVIGAFNPRGRVGGTGTIRRLVPNGDVHKAFDVRVKQCSIRHTHFDYPINNIAGIIKSRDHHYQFTQLTGNSSSGKIECEGTWDPNSGLDLQFLCRAVPLNDQLKFALSPDIQEIWDGFRPRGTLDLLDVDMKLPIGQREVDIVLDATASKRTPDQAVANDISIHPVWFPYKVNHLTGKVHIGENKIVLQDIEGQHQRTWISCQGNGRYASDSWYVKLNKMLVGSLKVDEDLLKALPVQLAPPIRQLKYQGLLGVRGNITIAGANTSPPKTEIQAASFQTSSQDATRYPSASRIPGQTEESGVSMAWDLQFAMNQAKLLIGFPIEDVFGSVRLTGQYDGQYATCKGDLDVDSLTIYDAQITNLKGPIWLDNERVGAGVFAETTSKQLDNNVGSLAGQNKNYPPITGTLYDGQLKFDAQMTNSNAGEFYLQASLADGSLETACREFSPSLTDIEGHAFAAVQMSGDYSGTHSHRGVGTIQLRDAKIYQLPVVLSLLKILRAGREAGRTAFDSSNMDFEIIGENIEFKRIELLGDAFSLIGNGKLNLDWDIDFNLYSILGRNRVNIPLVSELYHASSQKVLWIEIDGKLDNPQIQRHILGKLNDAFRQLFQPSDRSLVNRRFGRPFQTSPATSFAPTPASPDAPESVLPN